MIKEFKIVVHRNGILDERHGTGTMAPIRMVTFTMTEECGFDWEHWERFGNSVENTNQHL